MNTFAHIKPLFKYRKVAYYSVVLNGDDWSLFENFVQKHTVSNKMKLNHILSWLKVIGEKYGAQKRLFRNEAKFADASALPPIGIKRPPSYLEDGQEKSNNLRLYSFVANENVVILFNGDIKTTKYPDDCPNVKYHFLMANKLSKAIETAFRNNDLQWDCDYKSLIFDKNFKFEFD